MSIISNEINSSYSMDKESNDMYPSYTKGTSLSQCLELLQKYIDILLPLENLSDIKLYYEISKNISKMYFDAKSFRYELASLLIAKNYVSFVVRMMKKLNNLGVFKNDDIWFSSYYMYNINWNFSDASPEYAKELLKNGISNLLIANIGHKPYLDHICSKNVCYLVKASLSIVLNIVKIKENECIFPFKDPAVKENLVELVKFNNESINGLSTFILSYIIDEEDDDIIRKSSARFDFLTTALGNALKCVDEKKRQHIGFTVEELLEALLSLVTHGFMQEKINLNEMIALISQLSCDDNCVEFVCAIKILWNLSFNYCMSQELNADYDLSTFLDKCLASSNDEILKLSECVSWFIRKKKEFARQNLNLSVKNVEAESSGVYICYNLTNRETVIEICDKLKTSGINVWNDMSLVNRTSLKVMAEGMEHCAVVVIFLSDSLKNNLYCRSEAEYAFMLKKYIIPIIIEKKYKPNEWLKKIIGEQTCYNLCNAQNVKNNFITLLEELQRIMRTTLHDNDSDCTFIETTLHNGPTANCIATLSPTPLATEDVSAESANVHVSQWTRENINQWLIKHQLSHLVSTFDIHDGYLLLQMTRVRDEAPDYFFSSIEKKWRLDFLDILRLTYALENL